MQVTNNTQANMDALIAAFKDIDASKLSAAGVKDVSVVSNDKGFEISFNTTVDGKEMPVRLSLAPELETPDGVADEVALGTLVERLETLDISEMAGDEAAEFMNEVLARVAERIQETGLASTQVPSSNGRLNTTLFNLLEIMSLICQVGQEIKSASKSIKAADNEMQAQAYERQAEKTMAMAEAAKELSNKYMIVSVVMLTVSAAVSVGAGLAISTKGAHAETKASGVAKDMSNAVMNDTKPVNMNQLTTSQGVRAGKQVGAQRVDAIKAEFQNDPAIVEARAEYAAAVNDVAAKQQTLEGRTQALENFKSGAQNPPTKMESEMIADAQNRVDTAAAKLAEAKARVPDAKAKFQQAVMDVKGKYDSLYVNAPKADAKQLKAEMTVANEFAMKTLKGTEVTVGEGANARSQAILSSNDTGKIAATAANVHRANLKNETHNFLMALSAGAQAMGQLGNTLSQYWQSEVNYKAQSEAADAQREQAEAVRQQKDYDESKDLESAAQDIISAARQTMQKAYESQHEATREIFG